MDETISVNHKNSNHIENGPQGPLVCLRIYRPARDTKASSEFKPDQDGVIEVKKTGNDCRILRFQRQSAARRLLPKERVSKCLRHRVAKKGETAQTVEVLKSKTSGKCHFGNLAVCGSVWDCPVCAAKISERRRVELTKAVDQHTSGGGSVLLVTFTYSHQREDDLKLLLDKQSKAMIWFYQHKAYKGPNGIKARYMKRGRIRALEVNHGQANGWHPHIHELWLLDLHLHDYETLKMEVFDLWAKACARYGLGAPSLEHGVDIRGGKDAADYVTKYGSQEKKNRSWGIEDELTKAHVKKGRQGSRSAFQLLDDYIDGDSQAGALFVEYSKAFHRKQQLCWSKGLKAQFDLKEMTDEEIAYQEQDSAYLLAEIEPEEWQIILKSSTSKCDYRPLVLHFAEIGGADLMKEFIQSLTLSYRQRH